MFASRILQSFIPGVKWREYDKWVELVKAASRVFGTVYNPTRERNGLKLLRRNLIGPRIAHYYPSRFKFSRFTDKTEFVDSDEEYWEEKRAYNRARGKGPPKKGQGKRAAIKKKKEKDE